MNNQDIEILSYMRHNSRNSITEMSRDFGLSILEMMDRMKIYEKNYIRNYTCVLNFDKAGFKFDAFIILKINEKSPRGFEKFIGENKYINSFFNIGDGKYLIEFLFRNESVFNSFFEKMKKNFEINEIEILKINKEIKRECFLEN